MNLKMIKTKNMTQSTEHIWFDLAGTLYKETVMFNEAHDQLRFDAYATVTGQGDPVKAKAEFLKAYKRHGSNSAVFASLGKPSNFWMQAMDSLDFGAIISPDPEVTETLRRLKEFQPISIYTNFKRSKIFEVLELLEIPAEWFSNILSGDDVTRRKPALDGFYEIIRISGLPAEKILYVGDRVDVDIVPAKSLGIHTCLVYGTSDQADYCINSMREILNLSSRTS
jgi:FMN phosphatase YigB (HAD superfamily)